jgi:hypothetical protein
MHRHFSPFYSAHAEAVPKSYRLEVKKRLSLNLPQERCSEAAALAARQNERN